MRREERLLSDPPIKRAARRQPFFVEVRVQDDEGVYVYKARNLSAGGMFIDSPVPAAPGTCVTVGFSLPGIGRIECTGRVRWNTDVASGRVRHPGMGVAFDGFDEAARALIATYTDTNEL